jgi:hypothetical protein
MMWPVAVCGCRKLGELVLAAVADGASSQQAPAAAGGDSAAEVCVGHRQGQVSLIPRSRTGAVTSINSSSKQQCMVILGSCS